jgi:hypothetical protein
MIAAHSNHVSSSANPSAKERLWRDDDVEVAEQLPKGGG